MILTQVLGDSVDSEQIASFLSRTADAYQHAITFGGMVNGQLLPNEQHDGFYYAVLEKRKI